MRARRLVAAWRTTSLHHRIKVLTIRVLRELLARDRFGLISNSVFVFTCRVLGAMLTFTTQVVLARVMGAAELGLYMLTFSVCVVLSTVFTFGYPIAAVPVIGQALVFGNWEAVKGFIRRGHQLTSGIALLLACTAALMLLAGVEMIANVRATFFIITFLIIPFFVLTYFHYNLALAFSWFGLPIVVSLVIRPLVFLLFVLLLSFARRPLSAELALLGQLAIQTTLVAGEFLMLRSRLRNRLRGIPSSYDMPKWIRISLPLLVYGLFTGYFPEISIILCGLFLSPEEIAIYSVSYRTALLITFGISSVTAIACTQAAQLHAREDHASLQRLVTNTTCVTVVGALAGVLLLLLFGRQLLNLFGPEFTVGFQCLIILAFSQLVIAMTGPVAGLLANTGHQDLCVLVCGVTACLTAVLTPMLVPTLGLNGGATAVLLVTLCWTFWMHRLVVRHLRIHPSILAVRQFSGADQ
ncbi:MAG: lipopolysaccharide biosynthesis protein [Gammaproteobacteria bacterium]